MSKCYGCSGERVGVRRVIPFSTVGDLSYFPYTRVLKRTCVVTHECPFETWSSGEYRGIRLGHGRLTRISGWSCGPEWSTLVYRSVKFERITLNRDRMCWRYNCSHQGPKPIGSPRSLRVSDTRRSVCVVDRTTSPKVRKPSQYGQCRQVPKTVRGRNMVDFVLGPKTVTMWPVVTESSDYAGSWYGRCSERIFFVLIFLTLFVTEGYVSETVSSCF